MTTLSIDEGVDKLRNLGFLNGKVTTVDLYIDENTYLQFKELLKKYNHLKEEDIVSCMLYEFIENHK